MAAMRAWLGHIAVGLALLASAVSCYKEEPVTPITRRVLIYVSAGNNSLSGYLKDDQLELAASPLPVGTEPDAHVLLVLSQLPKGGSVFTTSAPVLYRMYANESGTVVRDTIKCWQEEDILCTPEFFRNALEVVYRRYPAKGYGMVFSSHATGWLPENYYYKPESVDPQYKSRAAKPALHQPEYFPPLDPLPGDPAVKSIGEDDRTEDYVTVRREMALDAFASALPFHLDYLLFDACLCGCVEVAHALRGVADYVAFSPTEVLANGFNYNTLARHLLRETPDPEAVCRDYFAYYDAQTGVYNSATITLVDTRRMDALESVCARLFSSYASQIAALKGKEVQGYFRYKRHFFYDLEDILLKAGITDAEKEELEQALDQFVVYKAATPWFMQDGSYGFPINCYSGLSMYLPSMGTDILDAYYKEHVSWNQATGLVH